MGAGSRIWSISSFWRTKPGKGSPLPGQILLMIRVVEVIAIITIGMLPSMKIGLPVHQLLHPAPVTNCCSKKKTIIFCILHFFSERQREKILGKKLVLNKKVWELKSGSRAPFYSFMYELSHIPYVFWCGRGSRRSLYYPTHNTFLFQWIMIHFPTG